MPQDQILPVAERENQKGLPLYSLHLDLIRGLAALLVLLGHLRLIVTGHTGSVSHGESSGLTSHPAHATGLGHAAVVIFFVLSGYLVGGSVVRDLRRNKFSWIEYALRRSARLWTVLLPTLVLGAMIDAITMHFFSTTRVVSMGQFTRNFHPPDLVQFLRYSFFLQSIHRFGVSEFGTNAALWSLSNEFWYYVLFPLLAVGLIGKRFPKLLRVGACLLAILLLWFLGPDIVNYFPLWLCGVAAYLVPATIPLRFQWLAIFVLTVQFCLVLFFMRSNPVGGLKADALIGLSFTLLLYAFLHQVGLRSNTFYARVAHLVSFPSYSLYATHVPFCILIASVCEARFPEFFRHTWLVSATICCLVFAYSGAFYLIFERNTDRVRSFAKVHLQRRRLQPTLSS